MNSNTLPSRAARRHRAGFTLIELLVVIMIIATLAGLSFGALAAVRAIGEKTKAKNDIAHVEMAVTNYYSDYNKYPIESGSGDVELETDQGFMSILMGLDEAMNPRANSYISPKAATGDVGGMISTGGGPGDFVDPWGKRFKVKIDGNYDEKLDNPDPAGTNRTLYQGVLVWSTGPDQEENSAKSKKGNFWGDNITSW